jgi:hypothetical protein
VKACKPFLTVIPLIFSAALAGQQRVRAADPLEAAERERAISLAKDEAVRQKQLQPDKFSLVGVEMTSFKDSATKQEPTPDSSQRHATVLFYRSDRNDGLQVLVDLGAGRVRDMAPVRGVSVPIGLEEIERAANLALADAGVKTLLGAGASRFRVGIAKSDEESTIEGLRVVGSGPTDPCSRQRCIDLFFRQNGSYIAGSRVTVNLSTNTVRVTNTRQ